MTDWADEQAAWDRIFEKRLDECRRELLRDAPGCIHLAAEFADLALEERRRSKEKREKREQQ
jgi:hypothetical protein